LPRRPISAPSGVPSNTEVNFYGGPHAGGFQCVFADGSVRMVRYSVDLTAVWRNVCDHQDGQVISHDDLGAPGRISLQVSLHLSFHDPHAVQ
jgi:prepilin-type processing-associated H-X9-DG protein